MRGSYSGAGGQNADGRRNERGGEGGGGSIPLAVLDAADEERVPEGVHLAPARIEHAREVLVHLGGAELVPVARGELVRDELVEQRLHVLEVRHVARRAHHRRPTHRVQPLDRLEPRERAV